MIEGFTIATRHTPSTGAHIAGSIAHPNLRIAEREVRQRLTATAGFRGELVLGRRQKYEKESLPDLSCRRLEEHTRIRATAQFAARDTHRKLEHSIGAELRLQETTSPNALAIYQCPRVSEMTIP